MKSKITSAFRAELRGLPPDVRRRARSAFFLFKRDPRHPGLRFKKVHPTEPIYSARVSQNYRAVCVLSADLALWFFIGNHSDYEKFFVSLKLLPWYA